MTANPSVQSVTRITNTCFMAIELSRTNWLVGLLTPLSDKIALGRQQALDAPYVLNALLHKKLPLAMQAFGILFAGRRNLNDGADLRFSTPECHPQTSFSASRRSVLARLALRLTMKLAGSS